MKAGASGRVQYHAMDNALVVYCTCPDRDTATALADRAVQDSLAACVNVVAGVTSVYRWKGAIEHDNEVLLIAKTSGAAYPALEAAWRDAHPYELPEIIAVPITKSLPGYLAWIEDTCAKHSA